MKILHVTGSMDPESGGPPQVLRNFIPALAAKAVSNEVVCCDMPDSQRFGGDAFPIHALGPRKLGFAYTPNLGPWLDENLHRFDAVIVHGLWLWPSICATRAVARERRRRAEAGDLRPELGDQRSEAADGETSAATNPLRPQNSALSPPRQLRCFVMPHGMLDPWFQRDKSRRVKAVRNWFYWWLVERGVVNSADALLFTCQQELELARTTFGGYQPKTEVVVGLGVDEPPAFEPQMQAAFAAQCPGLGGRPYILFLSRIHPKKGVDLLVRAYARVASERAEAGGLRPEGIAGLQVSGFTPQVSNFPSLVIAGPGWETDYGREVRALIDEANGTWRAEAGGLNRSETKIAEGNAEGASTLDLKLEASPSARIHAVGMLSGDAKWGSLYGCEAFILPSHQENFGIAVAEALACGKPVLISNQVNIWREIIEDGAGLVADDTEEGVEKLLRQFLAQGIRLEAGGQEAGGSSQSLGKRIPQSLVAPETAGSEGGSACQHFTFQHFGTAPRACYLRRFAIGPAAARLAEVLRAVVLTGTGLGL
jgi:glycosyltransferase involved in cell wall biosynthesis